MASRHKVHYRDPRFDASSPVACNQKHLKLLPLAVSSGWNDITCAKCLTHKPKPQPLSIAATVRAFFSSIWGGRHAR